jgi:hypothetical protein
VKVLPARTILTQLLGKAFNVPPATPLGGHTRIGAVLQVESVTEESGIQLKVRVSGVPQAMSDQVETQLLRI